MHDAHAAAPCSFSLQGDFRILAQIDDRRHGHPGVDQVEGGDVALRHSP